jgi:hypothetical protein
VETSSNKPKPYEEERELTLDEILGGGGGNSKANNDYQPLSLNSNKETSNAVGN